MGLERGPVVRGGNKRARSHEKVPHTRESEEVQLNATFGLN